MTRIPFEVMKKEFARVFVKHGFTPARAEESAQLFAASSLDGVYSHGINRVPRFVDYIAKGYVHVDAVPTRIDGMGSIERYDGNLGPGDLNAKFCMERATAMAHASGMGVVTINNTHHWMRGGNYGWQAARAGCIGICWTNTESCMPPWGAKDAKVGNNPFVIAVPREEGPVVLDMAMSQFSYGKLQVTRLKNEMLPVDGGFDREGHLTRDPGAVEESMRILPTGFWKGSGLAILLDLVTALLAGGLSTCGIDKAKPAAEVSCYKASQIFIAFDPMLISGQDFVQQTVADAIDYLHTAIPAEKNGKVAFPGERTAKTRKENLAQGIPVNDVIWNQILGL
jgi:3-dehydro-L-gulonate 2-dehydrogenase